MQALPSGKGCGRSCPTLRFASKEKDHTLTKRQKLTFPVFKNNLFKFVLANWCEGIRSPGTGLPCECWELNSGPLEEQLVHLMAEPSLQFQFFLFYWCYIGLMARARIILLNPGSKKHLCSEYRVKKRNNLHAQSASSILGRQGEFLHVKNICSMFLRAAL